MNNKKERYNIMLFPRIIAALDIQARRLDTSRSDLIQQILSDYIIENDLYIFQPEEQIKGQLEVM